MGIEPMPFRTRHVADALANHGDKNHLLTRFP